MKDFFDERFEASVTSADASSGVTLKAAVSGKALHITDIIISTDTALTISINDEDNNGLIPNLYIPANSVFSKSFSIPRSAPSGKGLKVTTSAAGNISVTVVGFEK